MKDIIVFSFIALFLFGCQTIPPETKVSTSKSIPKKKLEPLHDWSKTPIEVKEDTVIVDARSDFEFSLSHIDGAVHLRWSDFDLEKNTKSKKRLKRQFSKLARRLALKGIHPESHVIVYGKGPTGRGEEGRIAWMLYYLGVKNVSFIGERYLKSWPWSNEKALKTKNAKYWEPNLVERISIQPKEFEKLLKRDGEYKHNSHSMAANDQFRIIDVRSEKEYLGRTGLSRTNSVPDLGALNISFKEFFKDDGRLNKSVVRALKSIGIKKNTKLIVISEKGVRSSAVTMALIAMGFNDVTHLEGGLRRFLKVDM